MSTIFYLPGLKYQRSYKSVQKSGYRSDKSNNSANRSSTIVSATYNRILRPLSLHEHLCHNGKEYIVEKWPHKNDIRFLRPAVCRREVGRVEKLWWKLSLDLPSLLSAYTCLE